MNLLHPVNHQMQNLLSSEQATPVRRFNQQVRSFVAIFTPPEMPPVPSGLRVSKRAWQRNAAAIMAIREASKS